MATMAAFSSFLAAKIRFCSVSPPPPTCLLIRPANPEESEPILSRSRADPGVLCSVPGAGGGEGTGSGSDCEGRRSGLREGFWEERPISALPLDPRDAGWCPESLRPSPPRRPTREGGRATRARIWVLRDVMQTLDKQS